MSKKKTTGILITSKNPFHDFCRFKTGFRFSRLGNSRGFSIVSSMVAAGLMGLAMLSLTSTLIIPKKETRYVDQQFVNASLKYSILQALQNKWLCPCQFDFATYAIDTTISTPQEININELKDSCSPNTRTIVTIASPENDMGSGMIVREMKLSNLQWVQPPPNNNEYSGDLIISYEDRTTINPSDPNYEKLPIRSINPISVPVLFAVDLSTRQFLDCSLIAAIPPPPTPGTPPPPPLPPGTPPPGTPPPPPHVLPPFKATITRPPLSQGCGGVDGSVSTGSYHPNGGGFVASTATVHPAAYVGPLARVCGWATVLETPGRTPAPRIRHETLISGNAKIYDSAIISGIAHVSGGEVYGNAKIRENAWISGSAKVYGDAQVCGESKIYGGQVYGNARTCGKIQVYGNAKVYGNAVVSCYAQVYGEAEVYENADVSGDSRVYGDAEVYGSNLRLEGNARVYGDAKVHGDTNCHHRVYVGGNAQVSGGEIRCGKVMGEAEISGGLIKEGTIIVGQGAMIWGKTKMTGGTIVADQGPLMVGSPRDIDNGYETKISGGTISGSVQIHENADISGGTMSGGNIKGDAVVSGDNDIDYLENKNPNIYGGEIYGNAQISGTAEIFGQAVIYDDAQISGGKVYGYLTKVYGNAKVSGGEIYGSYAKVYGDAKVSGGEIYDFAEVFGTAEVKGGKVYNGAKVSNRVIDTGDEVNGWAGPP